MRKGVKREILYFVSGFMWNGVGIMLNILAIKWLLNSKSHLSFIALLLAIISGILVSLLGFNFIARKNIRRIYQFPDYTCIFNFQEVKSYFLIIFMIALGIFMRKSGYFSKEILIYVYTTIGTALFLSSFLYFQVFFKHLKGMKEPEE